LNISEFCIRRPVFTLLLMLSLLVAGVAGYQSLSVSALPNVDFPTIRVSANLPGASAETMANTVATPLERQLSTIAGITSMTSASTLGGTQITLQFDLNRDIDGAALDVQSAISTTQPKLPVEMLTAPSFQKVNPAAAPVLFLAVSSDSLPLTTVYEYANNVMAERISMVPGVAQAAIYGARKYAVRIQADPEKLAAQGLGFNQLGAAVAAAASNGPLGTVYGQQQLFNIDLTGQPTDADGFRELIALWKNGAPVKLGDIATVIDSVEDTHQEGFINSKPAVVIAIQRQPDANTIEVVEQVRALLPVFENTLPASISIKPLFDRSVSIKNAVEDVERTLLITFVLVVAVIYLFLRSFRATLITALAVPLSIAASIGGMALLDFSLNNVSLLALTLCVGFVVDDAIVMLENIVRHIENGMQPVEAAIKGAREISFTIVSMTVSLIAVFIPVLFMGGIVGRIFREFAITISMAVMFSGLIALTLTPMLSAHILSARKNKAGAKFANALEDGFQKLLGLYRRALYFVLRHRFATLVLTIALLVASVGVYYVAPKGFFPVEDTGFVWVNTEAAQDISYEAMLAKQKRAAEIALANPAVVTVFSSVGGGTINTGRMIFGLKPRGERPPVFDVIQELRQELSPVESFRAYMQPIQNIQIGGRSSNSLYQYTLQGSNLDELYLWSQKLLDKLSEDAVFQDVTSDMRLNSLEVVVNVDQQKAASLGVTFDDIRRALFSAYGSEQVATIYTSTDDYAVILEVAKDFQHSVDYINQLYITGSEGGGNSVPLSAFVTLSRGNTALSINHQTQLPSVTIAFNLASGVALGQAVDRITEIQNAANMPDRITGSFQGTAQAFQESLDGQGLLLVFTVLVIYIILGMLYESFIHPITILSGLPSAGLGAVLFLMLFGIEVSVISIIGIVLLIGIVKKNSIMMVDFAINARDEGLSPENAIIQGCLLRFRPIMMTTMAAIFGALPIALGTGVGSELRQPLGIAVVGGLLTSQLLTLFITPVVYLYLESLSNYIDERWRHTAWGRSG
jgi:HAE1 family hydrophobic/amphiphilic exporter-1